MKTRLLLALIVQFTINSYGQFQQDLGVPARHLSDANTIELQDGTSDYIVASTIWDNSLTSTKILLKRVDDITGTILWTKVYDDPALANVRGFDITRFDNSGEKIAITGSVISGAAGLQTAFIAKVDATNGVFIAAKTYTFPGNFQNSQGLHIIYTEQEVNFMPMPGFVVGGYINNAYNSSVGNNMIGFVLRVDMGLNLVWTNLIDGTNLLNFDYDVVNDITETNDGYFITGSGSQVIAAGSPQQQGVLAIKLDNLGNFVWESSYIFGNSRDIGVDAYYDAGSDEIYLLANYSITHYFGVTVLDNLTGTIDFTKSWYTTPTNPNFLNWYGFKINESLTDPDNLVIHGYIRDSFISAGGVSTAVQSTPFVYEFNKSTKNQVNAYVYEVPFVYPVLTDFYSFWNMQMPEFYYPDMSLTSTSSGHHFSVAYRTRAAVEGNIEMIETNGSLLNECNRIPFTLNNNPLAINPVSSIVAPIVPIQTIIGFNDIIQDYFIETCSSVASIDDNSLNILNVYPNPANTVIHLDLQQSTIKTYAIFNIIGKKVISGSANIENINVNNLKTGVYFLKIITENNKTYTTKFIKK
jgi:hypothetical protein